jgi:hypothetical protein
MDWFILKGLPAFQAELFRLLLHIIVVRLGPILGAANA